MKQCEIWDLSFDPTIGSEQKSTRPAVIISGDTMNDNYNLVILCPLTTSMKKHRANVVLTPNEKNGLSRTSQILVFHIKSVSKERLMKKRGRINDSQLEQVLTNLNKLMDY